ncbi:MAG: hypothetical protein A2086_05400 [Spirochaetes bacterium GWD1_27_9]|nr:MAG: hypothetical protein A2Z98_15855 [Spirochaetes bacterium GWB1_27_13]OHD31813.1 MAG: hypothetical protein A2086_05400 [Spirochaetes bacterium GWD1_27_9]
MEKKMTLEQVLQSFIVETKERFFETERLLNEKFQETDKIFQETEREILENSKQIKELTAKFQETDRKFQDTDRKFQETDKQIKNLMKKSSEFDSNWGKLIQALVEPAVLDLFKQRGINVLGTTNGYIIEKDGKKLMEIDILMKNGDCIVLIEVKTTLRIENVDEHIEKRLMRFKEFFPEYKDKKIYGAVAYLKCFEGADNYAIKKGLFALTFSGKHLICIKNDKDYKPKDFSNM